MKDEGANRGVGSATGSSFAIVVSTYHDAVTGQLLRGAMKVLREAGVGEDQVAVVRVPGSFEVPQAARAAAETGRFAAVVCLGCIIRGETPHFDYIASAVTLGITRAAQDTGVPITFGVLTTNTYEEAAARAGGGSGNKGCEAAEAAIELARVVQGLRSGPKSAPSNRAGDEPGVAQPGAIPYPERP